MPEVEPPWSEWVSLAVHELRTPANVVSGYVKMLLGGYGGPVTDAQRQALEEADKSAARLIQLMADLSEVARLASGRLVLNAQPVEVATLLGDAAAEFVSPLDHAVRCVASDAVPRASVVVDRARMARALATLAAAVARSRPAATTVTLTAEVSANTVVLLVTGGEAGAPSAAPHDLDPLPEGEGGLGVGLPAARLLAQAAGGRAGSLRNAAAYTLAVLLPKA